MSKKTTPTPEEIKKQEREKFGQALYDRAAELSVANGNAKVIPIWYEDPVDTINGKPIIGFLKEPNRATKGSILDTHLVSRSRAATIALNASLMKEVSDERIISSSQVYDPINIRAGLEALYMTNVATSEF